MIASSGGGIRTPDTRIMILRAEICNALTDADLEKSTQGRCTYCCTHVEINAELAEIITAWPSFSRRQRQALSLMATASGRSLDTSGG